MKKENMLKIASVIAAASITAGVGSGCEIPKSEDSIMYDNFVNQEIKYVIAKNENDDYILHKVKHAGIQVNNNRYGTIETECGEDIKNYPIYPDRHGRISYFTAGEQQIRNDIKPLTEIPTKYYYKECECVKINTNENTMTR